MTTTTTTTAPDPSPSPSSGRARRKSPGAVGTAAAARIRSLQYGYREDIPGPVSASARIRRGAGKAAGAVPDLWGMTGLELLDDAALAGLDVDRADEALHISVTLWALHQQGHREANMHLTGPGLGAAVRRLMPEGEIDEPIRKRFVRAGTAQTLDSLAQRLRELVLLLRADAVPLDYGLLADQLYRWQKRAERGEIQRAWGRSFQIGLARRADPAATD
ncbi:type I-E CRISPR-associated protein Cse2/CasB [Streptomyces sp. AK02-01A]|uniref:type I-E CRISPR-associated protein Cse2/CasB n=1 Tax=Streptomyces sp. AK02-01A TaxID=3028648 RepID=UPI0029AD7008|nr:type I-E CRISPR-associated protein Cse2/CasB [Streptomyces sp. AK02-01A]MDX3851331.1 type I-E CRISPR-associated protein Cse2/CasB [Streptomyces sp. AK02-01A]